jgi:flagellar basal body-associated protein FliL
MADEAEGKEEVEESKEPEKKSSKAGLYIGIIVIQLLVAGFLIWKYVMPEYNEVTELNKAASGNADKDGEEEEVPELTEPGVMYKIENLTVNPKGSRGMRFAVFEFSLEVPGPDEVAMLDKYKTVLIDNYIAYFRHRSMKELSNDSLLDSLKTDISNIANNVLGSKLVHNVYFTQFVLQ